MKIKNKIIDKIIEYWKINCSGIITEYLLFDIDISRSKFYQTIHQLKNDGLIEYNYHKNIYNEPYVVFPSKILLTEHYNKNINNFINTGEYTKKLFLGNSQFEKIFFDYEVLDRFQKNLEQFEFYETILGGIIKYCKNETYFKINFGKRETSKGTIVIFVDLFDLKNLPQKEQNYWNTFEINKLSFKKFDEKFIKYNQRVKEGQFIDDNDPLFSIKQRISEINEILGFNLYKSNVNMHLSYPKINNYKSFCSCCSELYLLLGPDNIAEKTIYDNLIKKFGYLEKDLINSKSNRKFGPFQLFYKLLETYNFKYSDFKKILDQLKKYRIDDAHKETPIIKSKNHINNFLGLAKKVYMHLNKFYSHLKIHIIKNQRTNIIKCSIGEVESKILPLLKGKIFHVTSQSAYKAIKKSGYILHNNDNKFKHSFGQSENSYGRNKAYVCLFDLKNVTAENIKEHLYDFDFLKLKAFKNKANVYFIISEKLHQNIISNAEAYEELKINKKHKIIVPYLECFYPRKIDLKDIEHVLIVKYIFPKSIPKSYSELALESLHNKLSKFKSS